MPTLVPALSNTGDRAVTKTIPRLAIREFKDLWEKWIHHQTGTAQSSQGWDEGSIGRKVRAGMGAVGTRRREAGCTSLLGEEEEGQFGQRDSVC